MKTLKANSTSHSNLPKTGVLLVDNHSIVRAGVRAILEPEPDIVVIGECLTSTAIEEMQKLRPGVVLIDITINGVAGLELVKRCAYDPQIKVVVLDLHAQSTYATRAIRNGAKGYVTADVESELANAIRRVITGKLWVSNDMAQEMVAALTQTANSADPLDTLSNRELEVVELIGKGVATSQIAISLGIGIKTVETHKAHIKKKVGIQTGSQLTRWCVQWYEQRNNQG